MTFGEQTNELVSEWGCCRGLGELPFLGVHISLVPLNARVTLSWTLWGAASSPGYQMPAASSGLYTWLTLSTLPTLRTPPSLLSGSPRGPLPVFMKTEHVIQTGPSDLAQLRIRGHSFTSPSCHWTLQAKAGLPLGGSQNLADSNESGVGVKLRCQTEWPGLCESRELLPLQGQLVCNTSLNCSNTEPCL